MPLLGKSDLSHESHRDESMEPVTAWLGYLSPSVSAGSRAEGAPRALVSLVGREVKLGATSAQSTSLGSFSHQFLVHPGLSASNTCAVQSTCPHGSEMEVERSVKEREHSSNPEPWREGRKAAEGDPGDQNCTFRDWGWKREEISIWHKKLMRSYSPHMHSLAS